MKRRARDFFAPPGTQAALFMGARLCQFQYQQGSEIRSKHVTPSTIRLAFNEEPLDTGWLAPGVVRWGMTPAGVFAVGYYAPAVYKLSIEFDKGRARRLRVPMPAIVFAGIGHNYYVWAMKENRPNPKAALFYAPLPNLNELGLICFGNNAHPDVRDGGFATSWQMFWDAPFSGHHAKSRSRRAPADVRTHLLQLSNARATKFPLSALLPMDVTLGDAVERLIYRERRR